MPKTIETVVYTFEELTLTAKERARDWWRGIGDRAWCDESLESIDYYCRAFGIALRNFSVDSWRADYALCDYSNANFRGIKLRDFDREYMPTGYYLDFDLWSKFYDTFKETGDAMRAFIAGLDSGFEAWRADMAWQESEEYIDELLTVNEYTFTESGERLG